MKVIYVDDASDSRLSDFKAVSDPELALARGLFIAEGRLVVRRLLTESAFVPRAVLVTPSAMKALEDALPSRPGIPVYIVPKDVMDEVAGFNMHRGCLAVAERPAERSTAAVLSSSRFVAVLERVVDADNIGSVFRSAEAFGVDAVLLSPGCCDPFYRKAIRTSSGAALVVPFATAAPWPDALDDLRAKGFAIAAMTPDLEAIDIGDFVGTAAARGPLAVLLGTEGHGLTAEALACADVRLRIPMNGVLDSLNIATAAGIALHRLDEVRRAIGTAAPPRRGGP